MQALPGPRLEFGASDLLYLGLNGKSGKVKAIAAKQLSDAAARCQAALPKVL